MDPNLSHEALVELLGAFAVDAVEPAEAAAIRAHLGVCPRCGDELAGYQQTAAMLANTGGEAPAGVWDADRRPHRARPRGRPAGSPSCRGRSRANRPSGGGCDPGWPGGRRY